jgi:hypothetical protein
MKVYFEKLPEEKNIKKLSLKNTTSNYYLLYSNEGIYTIKNDIITKNEYIDKPSKELVIDSVKFIIDNSYCKKNKCFKIPFYFNKVKISEMIYELPYDSSLKLIIQKKNNQINDIYCYTNKDNLHDFDKDLKNYYDLLY